MGSTERAESVEDVLKMLTGCIETARAENTADGYFPLLYSWETKDIATAADQGVFDVPDEARRMIVVFSNRYFEARRQFRAGEPTSKAWGLTFRAARSSSALVVQHLLLAINAHVNVDLPVAAAEADMNLTDYSRVDAILAKGVARTQNALNRTTFVLRLLDLLAGDFDEMFASWSLQAARRHAFELARRLRAAPEADRPRLIAEADEMAYALGERLLNPPFRDRCLIAALRLTERNESPRDLLSLLER